MIDAQVYAQEITLLQRWFGKELDDLVGAALFKSLNQKLETDEFALACRVIFENTKPSPFNFPSISDFVEAARGSTEECATQEWLIASNFSSGVDIEQLTPVGKEALRRIGGRKDLGKSHTDQMPFKKREFIKEYCSVSKESSRQLMALSPVSEKRHALN